MSVPDRPYRAERFVLSSKFASYLRQAGLEVDAIVHEPEGSFIVLTPADAESNAGRSDSPNGFVIIEEYE